MSTEAVKSATGPALGEGVRAALLAVLDFHPIQVNAGFDEDGYAEAAVPYCTTCRVAAPCPTRVAVDGAVAVLG